MTAFFMQYSQYLQTLHWQNKRREKLLVHQVCQVCKSGDALNIHHKKYNHDNASILFHERVQDLITLCASCHRLVHRYFGIDVKKINKKICRVRRLLELGVTKNKAFWIVANPDLYESVYQKIT